MKKAFYIFVLILFTQFANGQVYQLMPQYGYEAKRMLFDSSLSIPTTCGVPSLRTNITKKAAVAYDSCNKRFYYYDPKLLAWDTIKGGGGSSIDTTSLSNRIDQKIDSIKKSTDSVYFKKNGIWYYSFSDVIQNGRWGNDTALVIMAKVHNDAGSTLLKGEIVYLSGANGDVASVKRANNKFDSTSATTIGMIKDNIAANDTGWCVTQGQISKINTSAFTSGDIVYIDSIDGKFTKTKPYAPYHQIFIGVVERANAGNGQLYIKPQNGYEINELHDVQINNRLNNQLLQYSDTQKVWKNRSKSDILGYKSVVLTNVTQSGTSVSYTTRQSEFTFQVEYSSAGDFYITVPNLDINKIYVMATLGVVNTDYNKTLSYWIDESTDEIHFYTFDIADNQPEDDIMRSGTIEIRIYN